MRDFRDGPVVKTSSFKAGGSGSVPSWGAKTPYAWRPESQTIKQKQYCNKCYNDFKWATWKGFHALPAAPSTVLVVYQMGPVITNGKSVSGFVSKGSLTRRKWESCCLLCLSWRPYKYFWKVLSEVVSLLHYLGLQITLSLWEVSKPNKTS